MSTPEITEALEAILDDAPLFDPTIGISYAALAAAYTALRNSVQELKDQIAE
jgi:hypothetical protein